MSFLSKNKTEQVYSAGKKIENKLIEQLKTFGWITLRTDQSESPVDVVGINLKKKKVHMYKLKTCKQSFFNKENLEEFKKIPVIRNVIKHYIVYTEEGGIIFKWDDSD